METQSTNNGTLHHHHHHHHDHHQHHHHYHHFKAAFPVNPGPLVPLSSLPPLVPEESLSGRLAQVSMVFSVTQ